MICNYWPKAWLDKWGGSPLPRSYLVVDVETTGFDTRTDLITQIGHVLVRNCEIVDQDNAILNWTDCNLVRAMDVKLLYSDLKASMAEKGLKPQVTWKRMVEEGHDPKSILRAYRDIFHDASKNGYIFVGHSISTFDEAILSRNFGRFLEVDWSLEEDEVIDTLAIERATLKIWHPHAKPAPGESLKEWCVKVCRRMRADASLVTCAKRYGVEADFDKAHDAEFDCWMTHKIFEAMRAKCVSTKSVWRNGETIEEAFKEQLPAEQDPYAGMREAPQEYIPVERAPLPQVRGPRRIRGVKRY